MGELPLTQLIEMVRSGGAVLAPVFAYLWWFEREERRTSQKAKDAMSERVIVAMEELKPVIANALEIFKASGKGA